MKILAIIGSPRKLGNTYQVVRKIEERLHAYDAKTDFQYIFLRDQNLGMCTGCFSCIAQGEAKCPYKDDLQMIKTKMSESDGIILAAPSYMTGVPGIMKNFLDRLAYTMHRPCFFDKVFLAVTTVGGTRGMKQTLDQLALLAAGGRLAGKLGVSSPPIPMRGFDKKAAANILKYTKKFYVALQQKCRKLPGIDDWGYFNAFKAFSTYDSYQKACPADYSYYKDKAEYFYTLSGHYLRRLFGKMFKALMQTSFRFIIVKQPEKQDMHDFE